ncbi:hypothetical protein MJI47_30895, partial [Salmonella enterica subsp. enterica serovar Kentucky]|nr:hypothetical protein [Salmonella enterica subsp. enterica serovar Kentucky]
PEMDMAIRKARDAGRHISYFGPEANDFSLLEHTFIEYGQTGKALYSGMLNASGGVIDDLIVYYFTEDFFRLVVNSATREK